MNAFYADVTPAMAMSVIGDVFEAGVAAPVRALLDHGSDTAEQAYDAAKMILSHPEEAVRAFGEGVLADATNVVTAYERAGKALAHGDFAGAFAIWNDAAKSAFNLAALIVGGGPKWMRFARAAGAAAAMVKINLLKAAGAWVWRQARKAAEKADDAARGGWEASQWVPEADGASRLGFGGRRRRQWEAVPDMWKVGRGPTRSGHANITSRFGHGPPTTVEREGSDRQEPKGGARRLQRGHTTGVHHLQPRSRTEAS